MQIPLHVKIRKKLRVALNSLLSLFRKRDNVKHFIDKEEIRSIIIIRPNYRIGNLIFLTPLLNELHRHLPEAKIDIVVGMRLAGKILQPLPNVDKVIDIPRKLLRQPFELYRFIRDSRVKQYDLAINISAGSTSSQIVTTLVNARYKASYHDDKNWAPLTHTVKREGIYRHSAMHPIELLKLFGIELPTENIPLAIKLTPEEIETAQEDLNRLLESAGITGTAKVVALFRNARFDKKIPDEWWSEWYRELKQLDKNIVLIDILSPDILSKLNEDVLEYSNKNLRVLGAFFRCCNMYVSADTGPMHLASASGAKTLALFNKTNIASYGTLGKKDKTIDIKTLSPKEVARLSYEHLGAV